MDRFYLLVLVAPETWKKIHKGTYDQCMEEQTKLSDAESWMIVKPAREHFGTETFIIEANK